MPRTFDYGLDERQTREIFRAILAGPSVLLDSARTYGPGRSEARLGAVLAERGGNTEALTEEASDRGIAVINAAPYASGLLVRGSDGGAPYLFQAADRVVLERLWRIETISAKHGVSLGAAALQCLLRHARAATTLCGIGHPAHVAQTESWADASLPRASWEELSALPAEAE